MPTDLKSLENRKNPLRVVLWISFISVTLYVIRFTPRALNKGLTELLVKHLNAIIGLLLSISFVITYYRKSMLAWWIAILFVPIVGAVHIVLYEPSIHWKEPVGVGIGWLVFIMPYLAQRYEPYKQFIEKEIGQDL